MENARNNSILSFHSLRLDTEKLDFVREQINAILQQEGLVEQDYLVIGLHCCGDLTICMMDLYRSLVETERTAKGLVCVGCCYHLVSEENRAPISEAGKTICRNANIPEAFINSHSMRLATQGSKALWFSPRESPEEHVKAHFYRSLMELSSQQLGLELKKRRRHTSNAKFYTNFNIFIDSVFENYSLTDPTGVKTKDEVAELFRAEMLRVFDSHSQYFEHLKIYRALQGAIQRAIESFIVWDRKLYAEEILKDLNCDINVEPVFNCDISPRNLAIVIVKKS